MRIAVVGGLGNYGLTLAGLAKVRGHDIVLVQFPGTIPRFPGMPQKNYEPLIRRFKLRPSVTLHNPITGVDTRINLDGQVLRHPAELPSDIDIMIVAYPSLLHERIGLACRGKLGGRVVITFTDRVLGGYSLLHQAQHLQDAQLIGINATPLTAFADHQDPFRRILYNVKSVRYAVRPRALAAEGLKILESITPGNYSLCSSLLDLAFNCTPSNLHAPHDLLNVVRYEQGHVFTMFHEGFTEGVERLITAVSDERCTVAAAYGLSAPSFLDYERQTYGYTGDSITENRRLNPALNHVPAPRSLFECKGIEDVLCALVPLTELADRVGVETPTMDALITLWGYYLAVNPRQYGRSLESIGLDQYSNQELLSL